MWIELATTVTCGLTGRYLTKYAPTFHLRALMTKHGPVKRNGRALVYLDDWHKRCLKTRSDTIVRQPLPVAARQ